MNPITKNKMKMKTNPRAPSCMKECPSNKLMAPSLEDIDKMDPEVSIPTSDPVLTPLVYNSIRRREAIP